MYLRKLQNLRQSKAVLIISLIGFNTPLKKISFTFLRIYENVGRNKGARSNCPLIQMFMLQTLIFEPKATETEMTMIMDQTDKVKTIRLPVRYLLKMNTFYFYKFSIKAFKNNKNVS